MYQEWLKKYEKIKRKKCKYCEEEKKIEERKDDNIYFTIYGRFLRVQGRVLSIPLGRTVKINYCPMCRTKERRWDKMTEEQEAIKSLDKFANTKYGAFSAKEGQTVLSMLKEKEEKIEYYKKQKNYDDQFKHELLENIRCLNLDKDEKDKEIEHWKNGFERELEDNRKNTYELLKQDLIIRQKDKQIDLMCYAMTHEEVPQDEYCIYRDMSCEVVGGTRACKDCIKQYFERKRGE